MGEIFLIQQMVGLLGGWQAHHYDIYLRQYLWQRRGLIGFGKAVFLVSGAIDSPDLHAELDGRLCQIGTYAAGSQDQHATFGEGVIGKRVPAALTLLFAVKGQMAGEAQ